MAKVASLGHDLRALNAIPTTATSAAALRAAEKKQLFKPPPQAASGEAAPAGDGSVVDVLEAAVASLGAALEQLDARSGGARVLHKMVSTQDEGVKRIGRLLAAADMAAVRAATEGRLEAPTTPPADTTDES